MESLQMFASHFFLSFSTSGDYPRILSARVTDRANGWNGSKSARVISPCVKKSTQVLAHAHGAHAPHAEGPKGTTQQVAVSAIARQESPRWST